MGERNAVGYGNAGKGMPEAVQGAEVVREAGRFLYGIDLLMNIGHAAYAVPAGKNIGAAFVFYFGKQFPDRLCQGNTFISMTFCSFLTFSYYIDEALFKINVRPFESEKFASGIPV